MKIGHRKKRNIMIDQAFYLASEEIARRCGLTRERYVTKDGRFVLDNKDLSRIHMTSEEFITGIRGIERVSEEEATAAIAANDYTLGKQTPNEEEE